MFTFRNSVAVAVFLFGSTFLWMTPLFIGPTATGALWTAAQVLGFLAIIGFTVAAWGIFKAASWWERVALAAGVVGVAAVIPYAIAAPATAAAGDSLSLVINIALHVLGSAGVIAALLMHPIERWIEGQL
ncbi:MAG TPA: hypothetical protein VLJ14_05980 [Ktedonobacterales bacterium]|nr:hypothetical protein [Ktedonobacterales bacterium]